MLPCCGGVNPPAATGCPSALEIPAVNPSMSAADVMAVPSLVSTSAKSIMGTMQKSSLVIKVGIFRT